MELRGKLEKFDFSDILQMLASSGKSGKLSVTQRAGQGVLVLREGRIIYAASSSVRETLGSILLCRGLITEDELRRSLDLQLEANKERRLGAILLEQGLVSKQDLSQVVKEQFGKVVFELLKWHSGYFRFEELQLADCGEVEIDALEFLYSDGLPADEVLLELSVKMDEAQRDVSPPEAVAKSESSPLETVARSGSMPEQPGATQPATSDRPTPLSNIMTESHTPEFTGEIILAILEHAQRIARRGVLFRCSPLGFAGMGQFGVEPPSGLTADFVRKVNLPLALPSILTEAVARKTNFSGPLEENAVNRYLIRRLGGGWPTEVVAAPLIVSGRVSLIFYGDNLPGLHPLGPLEDLEVAMIEAGLAMEKSSLAKREKHLREFQRTH
ncbi:MAG: DUF4388 domain-containing protein [bacterium]|nr:DUF4388 domain-containing protein [bacterium]